jgi:hypothetical protein
MIDVLFIAGLLITGAVLERIGEPNSGVADWFFTPFPLALSGVAILLGQAATITA